MVTQRRLGLNRRWVLIAGCSVKVQTYGNPAALLTAVCSISAILWLSPMMVQLRFWRNCYSHLKKNEFRLFLDMEYGGRGVACLRRPIKFGTHLFGAQNQMQDPNVPCS